MDRTEEDMKFVGFFGIFKQSFKTIFSHKKIFAQITLTLLLPLTLLFFTHLEISRHVFRKIDRDLWPIDDDVSINRGASALDWLYYFLFKLAYFTALIVLSLLSTAAVVFTVASAYTGRDVVFRKVLTVVPKVYKRLFLTLVFTFLTFILYNALVDIILLVSLAVFGYNALASGVLLLLLVLYAWGFLYLSVVWLLASVAAVLENTSGFKAMKKGRDLVKGRKAVGMGIAFVMYGILVGIKLWYGIFVEYGDGLMAMVWRILVRVLAVVLVLWWFLLLFVVGTVVYLVCKSHHREMIDKLSLSSYLGAYVGDTVVAPKMGEEIQLGRGSAPAPAPATGDRNVGEV